MAKKYSYEQAGVNIDVANATKGEMRNILETKNKRVLNKVGAFASLFDISFPDLKHPVLVLKMEEPGSKQKLAFEHDRITSLCYDLVNHLVNDVIVMGAQPLAMLDVVICGKLEKDKLTQLVTGLSKACKEQECVLVGGETSEQPGVLEAGNLILAASLSGVVDKSKIIDGSTIREGDIVLALPSNGLHTNGYSLVRKLIDEDPDLLAHRVGAETFLDAVMKPHTAYYHWIKGLFDDSELHGMAHITGGGIGENLNRILPPHLDASIDLNCLKILPIFKTLRVVGKLSDKEVLRTFNMGVGMALVVAPSGVADIQARINQAGGTSYPIGTIIKGNQNVIFQRALAWQN